MFAGGLHPPTTATVVDGTGSEVVTTDGPFSESKEQIGGFWVVEAPDLDAALDIAARGSRACQRQGRGPPLPGRVSTPDHGEVEAVYRAEFGTVVASLTARFRDLDLAEEMAQEAFVEAVRRWPTEGVPPNPGGLAHRHRPQPRPGPAASRVHPAGPARGGHDAHRPGGPPGARDVGDRRAAPAPLHVLPPRARSRGPGGPHPPAARRAHRAGGGGRASSCPSARWRSGSPGPSARSRPPTSPTGSPATPSCPGGSAASSPSSTSSSPRGTSPARERRHP